MKRLAKAAALVALMAGIPALARAADGPAELSTGWLALRAAFSLAAVLALLFLLQHLFKRGRFAAVGRPATELIALRGRLDLGARREIRLVEVRDRLLVVGITNDNMTLLAELDAAPATAFADGAVRESRAAGATADARTPAGPLDPARPFPAFAAFLQKLISSS